MIFRSHSARPFADWAILFPLILGPWLILKAYELVQDRRSPPALKRPRPAASAPPSSPGRCLAEVAREGERRQPCLDQLILDSQRFGPGQLWGTSAP